MFYCDLFCHDISIFDIKECVFNIIPDTPNNTQL